MGLDSDLKDALAALKPHIDETKAAWELDNAAKSIAGLLAEPYGLFWLEYISDVLDYGKQNLYSSNQYVPRRKFDAFIEQMYRMGRHEDLRNILPLYHQLFGEDASSNDANLKYVTLKKIEGLPAVRLSQTVVAYCLKCFHATSDLTRMCPECSSDDILGVSKIFFLPQVKTILSNGQFLEIYAKHCLQSIGIELIGYPLNKQEKKGFTNVRYQVDGDIIEVDVHGIAHPLTFILCETKTSAKIASNELRRLEGLYDRLVEKVKSLSGRGFTALRLFIITGYFDENISVDAYKRKGWELIDRSNIEELHDVLKRVQSSL